MNLNMMALTVTMNNLMLAACGGSIDKGQIGTIIYSAKFPLKHHLLFRSHTIFEKSNNRQFKTIIFS